MSNTTALPGPVYEVAFLRSPVAKIVFDVSGEILEANLAAEGMFNYTREEVRGQLVEKFAREEFREEIREGIRRFIESGKDEFSPPRPLFGQRRDGSSFPVEIRVARCVVGETTYLILKVWDITARELQTKEFGKVAHEIRTPLNGLLGYLENYIDFGWELSEDQKVAYMNKMRNLGQMLVGRVQTLLDLANSAREKTPPRREPIRLKHLVDMAVEIVELDFNGKGLSLEVNDCSTGSSVYTDWELVVQILENLLTNARKFTNIGGVIIICEDDDDEARIIVKDSGIGIPSDKLNAIFDDFFQVREPDTAYVNGLGVGLSLSKKYARLMGGDITVTSEEGKGSTFTLHLPKRHDDSTKPLED